MLGRKTKEKIIFPAIYYKTEKWGNQFVAKNIHDGIVVCGRTDLDSRILLSRLLLEDFEADKIVKLQMKMEFPKFV